MKYLLLGLLALICALAFFELRLRNPRCPRCLKRTWRKHVLTDWRCANCNIWFDPTTKEFSFRPVINSKLRELL